MSYFTNKGWTERSVFKLLNDEDASIFDAGDLLVVASDIEEDSARFKLKENFNQYQEPYLNWIVFKNLKYIGELAEQCDKFEDYNSSEVCVGKCNGNFKEKDVNTEYEVGDLVEVVDSVIGHRFKIGDVVVIDSIDTDGTYKCVALDKKDCWWLTEDEFKLHKKVSKDEGNEQLEKPKLRTAEDFRKLAPTTKIEVVVDGHKAVIPLLELLMISRLSGSVMNAKRPNELFYFFESLFSVDGVDPLCDLDLEKETRFTNLESFINTYFTHNKKLEVEKQLQDKLDQIEKLRNEVYNLDIELSKYS